jgi:hypothetical protein
MTRVRVYQLVTSAGLHFAIVGDDHKPDNFVSCQLPQGSTPRNIAAHLRQVADTIERSGDAVSS